MGEVSPHDRAMCGNAVAGGVRPTARPHRRALVCLLTPALLGGVAAHAGKCTLARLPDIPVTMQGLVPMVHAQINGTDALFVADSGAFFSLVSRAAVAEFHLTLESPEHRLKVQSLGEIEETRVARAKTFAIFGQTFRDVEFLVSARFSGDAAGLLGQNLFRAADVEYDLANGVIRLVRPKDCKDATLAYWAEVANKPFSVIDIEFATANAPHTRSVAYLNGTKIRVIFDTGAARSVLRIGAAKRAGITPTSAGVVPDLAVGSGAHQAPKSWIAPFASFKIGAEEIGHARLRFADLDLPDTDMLIGADFFLSHRIYVASSQRKLYFTYNGGPVFDLTTAQAAAPAAGAAAAPERPPAESSRPEPDARLDQPTDAAGYARRAAASVARRDYANAIADLTRATELAPGEASYLYERGMAYWYGRQAEAALADFDAAIKLKPDDVNSLLARASMRTARHDSPAAVAADLEAADRAAPKESEAHLRIGALYSLLDKPAAALSQYSMWIETHGRDDWRMPNALNSRCWARALLGQGLDQALADCNAALKMRPNTGAFLDSRGLVYLRQGNYDKAIADYDAALRLRPRTAWSLYGRGLARLHKGQKTEGEADIAAATALQPKIAERAGEFGLKP